jgi:hypothetical protein
MKKLLMTICIALTVACSGQRQDPPTTTVSQTETVVPLGSPASTETVAETTTTQTTTYTPPIVDPTTSTPIPSMARLPEPIRDMSNVSPATVTRISVADARAKVADGSAVMVDVRALSQYQQSHIPGSIHVQSTDVAENLGKLPRDKMLITYCT